MLHTSTNWQRESSCQQEEPALEYKDCIIELFNSGALQLENVKWYYLMGYAFIIHAGTLVDIVRDMPATTKRRDLKCAN